MASHKDRWKGKAHPTWRSQKWDDRGGTHIYIYIYIYINRRLPYESTGYDDGPFGGHGLHGKSMSADPSLEGSLCCKNGHGVLGKALQKGPSRLRHSKVGGARRPQRQTCSGLEVPVFKPPVLLACLSPSLPAPSKYPAFFRLVSCRPSTKRRYLLWKTDRSSQKYQLKKPGILSRGCLSIQCRKPQGDCQLPWVDELAQLAENKPHTYLDSGKPQGNHKSIQRKPKDHHQSIR